jgi:murein L,D-transpeptidase YafK
MKFLWFIFIILVVNLTLVYFFYIRVKKYDKSIYVDKIVVEKSKRRMYLYTNGDLIKTYKISLGRTPIGDKEYEGDKKTPEGSYIINDKNSHSKYYKNLGISYPNKLDIEEAKRKGMNPGGQIKIHGLRNGLAWIGKLHLLVDWTAGCIALTNKEMDELFLTVKIGTPIDIKP